MTEGGDERRWWRWEVVTKGSGEGGKWWWRGVVTKGSGEEGKWWRREVERKGSDDEGEWWGRELATMKGSGAWCCKGSVLGRSREHEILCFSVESGCRRRWKVPRLCGGCGCGRFIVFFCRSVTGGFKLLWMCLCVRSYRVFWNLCL